MARKLTSAAFFCLVASGLSGCLSPNYVQRPTQAKPEGVVAVPINYPWVSDDNYKAAAIRFIKENDPNFDEKRDIVYAGPSFVGKQTVTDQVKIGPDGKPTGGDATATASVSTTSNLKEYRVTYRSKMPNVTSNVMQTGSMQRPGAMGGGVVQAGGMPNQYSGGTTQYSGMAPSTFGGNGQANVPASGIPPTGSQLPVMPSYNQQGPGVNSGPSFGPNSFAPGR